MVFFQETIIYLMIGLDLKFLLILRKLAQFLTRKSSSQFSSYKIICTSCTRKPDSIKFKIYFDYLVVLEINEDFFTKKNRLTNTLHKEYAYMEKYNNGISCCTKEADVIVK